MTEKDFQKVIVESLVEAIHVRNDRIAVIEDRLKTESSVRAQCQTYLHNARGMAVEQFPDLDSTADAYECIRLAFKRLGSRQGK